ncbi:MAG: PAS domain S-box protein [Verrucomicrobiales bacterium]|nr:PAS domain S-box protein [Verrucomicrobiales bacterium]
MWSFRDVTEQKQAEEGLRESENRFRALIENAPDGVVLLSAEGVMRYASPTACAMFGVDPEGFLKWIPPRERIRRICHRCWRPWTMCGRCRTRWSRWSTASATLTEVGSGSRAPSPTSAACREWTQLSSTSGISMTGNSRRRRWPPRPPGGAS